MQRVSSLVSPQVVVFVMAFAIDSPVAAGPFTISSGTNTSLATAQAISLPARLVLHQQAPNYSLATAQPVSPQYKAFEAFGSISAVIGQEFFSLPLGDGDHFHGIVRAGNPGTQFPELLLYDSAGNLVAIANGNGVDGSSSQIDFTVPSGDAGNWTVEVTGSPSAPGSNFFNYDLFLFGEYLHYQTNVLGAFDDPNHSGFYSVATNSLDHLSFFVRADNPGTQFPELLLYNSAGNLVAIANGNGVDGSSSQIDFTVPSGEEGNWTVQVTGSPSAPGSNFFNYDLRITGDTGIGPINPLNELVAAVPEPSTLSLMASGALAFLALIRRRRAR